MRPRWRASACSPSRRSRCCPPSARPWPRVRSSRSSSRPRSPRPHPSMRPTPELQFRGEENCRMRTLVEATGPRPRLAIVLLSGSYTEPEDFLREGFVDALRARGVEAEVVMAGVRAAYFADASVVDRIRESVLLPLQARGFGRTWIAGISLGALAALCHAARHEDEAERRVLLSPYPGTREVWGEIAAAGGLASWQPSLPCSGDLEREAWHWLAEGGARRTAVE